MGSTDDMYALGGGYGPISPLLGVLIFAAIVVMAVIIMVRRR